MTNTQKHFYQVLLGVLVLVVAFSFVPSQAFAYTLVVDNPYNEMMYVAVVNFNDSDGKWHTKGWWNVTPKSTRTLDFPNSNRGKFMYIYAKTANAQWSGAGYRESVSRTVIGEAFDYADGQGYTPGSNPRTVYFMKWDIENGEVYWSPLTGAYGE